MDLVQWGIMSPGVHPHRPDAPQSFFDRGWEEAIEGSVDVGRQVPHYIAARSKQP